MNEEQINQIERQENLRNQITDTETKQIQQQAYWQDQEKSMIKDQLDLSEELDRIEHLLRGHILKRDDFKGDYWEEPEDKDMIVLSEYGIHLIMNAVSWYINKNTLLSNYDDKTILTKMEDFATDLADTVFMEYEKVFQYPTFEDCKKILMERIDYKTKMKMFTYEVLGQEADKEQITQEIMDDMQGRIEKEIQKIKEQIIKNKLKRFLILIRTVQDAVHSTYNRSWKGEERRTLREHIHISEARGMNFTPMQQQGRGNILNPFNWFK